MRNAIAGAGSFVTCGILFLGLPSCEEGGTKRESKAASSLAEELRPSPEGRCKKFAPELNFDRFTSTKATHRGGCQATVLVTRAGTPMSASVSACWEVSWPDLAMPLPGAQHVDFASPRAWFKGWRSGVLDRRFSGVVELERFAEGAIVSPVLIEFDDTTMEELGEILDAVLNAPLRGAPETTGLRCSQVLGSVDGLSGGESLVRWGMFGSEDRFRASNYDWNARFEPERE